MQNLPHTNSEVSSRKTIRMIGTHGVPALYGGFETAVENISLHLVANGWRVIVYCQVEGGDGISEDIWRGIERVLVPTKLRSWKGTAYFDWVCYRHAMQHHDLCGVFGYNTGLLNLMLRSRRIPTVINMDGIEWRRERWNWAMKAVLRINERFAAWFGNHLVADHPEISRYLGGIAPEGKISMIAYGAHPTNAAPTEPIERMGLSPSRYMTIIARPVPENSILELVRAFSAKSRGIRLAILGTYDFEHNPYHVAVRNAASLEVDFVGGIYDSTKLASLRYHSLAYMHGHRVGGTNPSLVEAMGAGNAIIAHDNPYNRWVAGSAAVYFSTSAEAEACIERLADDVRARDAMRSAARQRFLAEFGWPKICGQYEKIFERFLPPSA